MLDFVTIYDYYIGGNKHNLNKGKLLIGMGVMAQDSSQASAMGNLGWQSSFAAMHGGEKHGDVETLCDNVSGNDVPNFLASYATSITPDAGITEEITPVTVPAKLKHAAPLITGGVVAFAALLLVVSLFISDQPMSGADMSPEMTLSPSGMRAGAFGAQDEAYVIAPGDGMAGMERFDDVPSRNVMMVDQNEYDDLLKALTTTPNGALARDGQTVISPRR